MEKIRGRSSVLKTGDQSFCTLKNDVRRGELYGAAHSFGQSERLLYSSCDRQGPWLLQKFEGCTRKEAQSKNVVLDS